MNNQNQSDNSGLIIYCSDCENQIKTPAALLFSPPDKNNECKKFHLCEDCYKYITFGMKVIK